MAEDKICPVCLGQIEHTPFSLKCGHDLHELCFDQLCLSGNENCPVCNLPIDSSLELQSTDDEIAQHNQRTPLINFNHDFLNAEQLLTQIRAMKTIVKDQQMLSIMLQGILSSVMDIMEPEELELFMIGIEQIMQQ
ncbi:Zinc finger, C3HC4 type (RING finger) domain-containing protein [Spironucleus salmonicida]|uniref:Zinc finger, C3HC4 type (RING finger) domain-containing protein n=1 Tax=Spironucleus salmonicida TaxID=348837 RepID=V6LY06_9EUKA|nr:Zinc finger, C3HC4 type (RING finger) domain-containing protein [Spironucleus salmonicida]|eukprot:EST45659.1 Zinc finger, C3HC4 type (RING finger) domain-containing protein [Spironucleus salmonicida]